MAIDKEHFRQIVACNVQGRALSAGYPDLLIHLPKLKPRPDSDKVAAHHGVKHPIADSVEVFAGLGLTLEVIDRKVIQGCEHVVDLNERPTLDEDYGTPEAIRLGEFWDYDLVIDPGTSEHCFNIAQALLNLADAVKVGGCIVQALPITMVNHGYWNVNPVALVDFYEQNGFQIEDFVIRHPGGIFNPPVEKRHWRMSPVPDGAVTVLTARRLEKREFRWPQQRDIANE